MKLITRNTDYAIRAICLLSKRKNDLVGVPELVKELKISRPFLRKIMQELGKSGMVNSYKGIGGGFKLSRNPDDIYLTDIIKIFQGPFSLNECFLNKALCPNRKLCPLKKKLDDMERYVASQLGRITIGGLLRE